MATPVPNAFDPERDFYLGSPDAEVTMIAYGDYADARSQRIRDILRRTADRLEDQVTLVYRPLPPEEHAPEARRAARAAVAAGQQGQFWAMHAALFDRGQGFSEGDVRELARRLDLDLAQFEADLKTEETTRRLQEDRQFAEAAGVRATPALFIDGRPYYGAWDELSIIEAVERPLGVRVHLASQAFFHWAAAAGLVLVLATVAALVVANAGFYDAYEAFRETPLGVFFGEDVFRLSVEAWINDGLMAIFFLLVGIEIKREIVDGELSDWSTAALPIVGALGGMALPALIYTAINAGTPTAHGWGVPMATDIAFTLGLMALLGRRVPNALKVFVSALAIADDLGAILVIAFFYSEGFAVGPLLGALAVLAAMLGLNRGRVYARTPYLLLGAVLWGLVHASGLHATLAGVLTAALIPSRRSGNIRGVAAQAGAIFDAETARAERLGEEAPGIRPGALRVLQNALERLRAPGFHLQHALENGTNFLILPLFAFFNTGILIFGSSFSLAAPESLGVILGLTLGKPLGIVGVCWVAVRLGLAKLSSEISWRQLLGAGCLCGVGFTMSIFIATAAFEGGRLGAVKLSILLASVLSATLGMTVLYRTGRPHATSTDETSTG